VVEGGVVGACRESESGNCAGRGAAQSDPDVSATGTGGLADNVGNREAVEETGEGVAVVGGLFHQVGVDDAGGLAVEVKAQESEGAGVVGQAHEPRRCRLDWAEPLGARVAVLIEASVDVSLHGSDMLAGTDAACESPGRGSI
jgi:hypothetical protein